MPKRIRRYHGICRKLAAAIITETRKIRELYQEYLEGTVTFEHLVATANERLTRWEAEKAAFEAQAPESPSNERHSPGRSAAADEPRIRDLYQEYLEGRVTFEHLVETANRFLARWEAGKRAPAAQSAGLEAGEPGS